LGICRLLPPFSMLAGPVRLTYQPYFFSEGTVFFSHNKSANNTFQPGFSAKRTGRAVQDNAGPTLTAQNGAGNGLWGAGVLTPCSSRRPDASKPKICTDGCSKGG
jgi:hypothetical protein